MSDQPEALRLAEELGAPFQCDFHVVCEEAAAELRRLHEENERLQIDGDRYRWVCDHALAIDLAADPDNFVQVWVGTDPARVFRGKTLDDAIDEAMKRAALRQEETK